MLLYRTISGISIGCSTLLFLAQYVVTARSIASALEVLCHSCSGFGQLLVQRFGGCGCLVHRKLGDWWCARWRFAIVVGIKRRYAVHLQMQSLHWRSRVLFVLLGECLKLLQILLTSCIRGSIASTGRGSHLLLLDELGLVFLF